MTEPSQDEVMPITEDFSMETSSCSFKQVCYLSKRQSQQCIAVINN